MDKHEMSRIIESAVVGALLAAVMAYFQLRYPQAAAEVRRLLCNCPESEHSGADETRARHDRATRPPVDRLA